MASFLVEAYLSTTSSLEDVERRASLAADECCRDGSNVTFVRSIYVAEDETCFLVVRAGSREAVRRCLDRAGIGAQRIVEALEAPAAS